MPKKKAKTEKVASRKRTAKLSQEEPDSNVELYEFLHSSVETRHSTNGRGFFARHAIPEGTTVLVEKALTLGQHTFSDADAMFRLIAKVLKLPPHDFRQKMFLAFCPDKIDEHVINYGDIELAHKKHTPELSKDAARLFAAKYMRNGFGFDDGPCLLFRATSFNHSCQPNENVLFRRQVVHSVPPKKHQSEQFLSKSPSNANEHSESYVVFFTTKSVRKGEELLTSYGHARRRRKKAKLRWLQSQYGFVCKCSVHDSARSKK